MRVILSVYGILLTTIASVSTAASAGWGFTDATVTIQSKGAGVGSGVKEK